MNELNINDINRMKAKLFQVASNKAFGEYPNRKYGVKENHLKYERLKREAKKNRKFISIEDYHRDIEKVKQEAFMIGRIYNRTGEKENPAEIQEILDLKCQEVRKQ